MTINDKLTLVLGVELAEWVAYVSSLRDVSKAGYIKDLIEHDMDTAQGATLQGFKQFKEARKEQQ